MKSIQTIPGLRIAIDGPSGSGKGTIAKTLGEFLQLPVLDTGLLYRFVAWRAINSATAPEDEEALVALLQSSQKKLVWNCEGIFFGGNKCNAELRSEAVAAVASSVASLQGVRRALLSLQQTVAKAGCIMDGRDVGTVVLPDAEAKFFLTASQRERARRRWMQLREKGDDNSSIEAILNEMKTRDARDASRDIAPLLKSDDAIFIDSTTMRPDEVIDRILAILERRKLIILNNQVETYP
ncbi:MAG: (d)CMP kinase [Zetaproteobacteria bacterium]|nr:(d)CMP kinase [Zetaproteobacteria bacterium]